MSDLEQFIKLFSEALAIEPALVNDDLKYNSIQNWDSISHMNLITALESHYDIMLDTDDIIDMSSVAKAKEILAKYNVQL